MDFMYGLAEVKVGNKTLGYIEENSFKLNGTKGESTEINAAQVHSAPVLIISKKNGSIAPSFDLIQMNYVNMAVVMGGTVTETGTDANKKATGWKAPSKLVQTTDSVTIMTDSDHQISIKKALVTGYIDGDLNLDSVSKIKMEIKVMMPDDGSEPYSIDDVVAG